jgi:uncharacterized protein YyaL (SSP411 family)
MFAPRIAQSGRTVPMMMAALSTYHAGMSQIVIAEGPAEPGRDGAAAETRALMDIVRQRYMPFAVIVPLTSPALSVLLPWTEAMSTRATQPTAYVCRDFACLAPATSAKKLSEQLERRAR